MSNVLEANLRVPLASAREAEIVYNSLRVDKEPKRGGTVRSMRVDGSAVVVEWKAKEARTLRVSVNSFMDLLSLVIQTIEQFGPPLET